ncbi:MAG: type II toxin-antitoxin system VapC family toxin [Bradyrhizobium sp.]|nr:type II toxin-antitoxin system VapC family toxin [Bradyrhizobium sp.]
MLMLLLDTHTAIWIVANQRIAREAEEAINAIHETGGTLLVSPITAWEVGLLVSHKRVDLLATPQRWFTRLLSIPNVRLAALSPEILIASSFLPGKPPNDPADRILLATARDLGATLITRDRLLLKYGEDGQVSTIAC